MPQVLAAFFLSVFQLHITELNPPEGKQAFKRALDITLRPEPQEFPVAMQVCMQWTTNVHPMHPTYIDNVTVASALSLEKYEQENTYTCITHTYMHTLVIDTCIHTYIQM